MTKKEFKYFLLTIKRAEEIYPNIDLSVRRKSSDGHVLIFKGIPNEADYKKLLKDGNVKQLSVAQTQKLIQKKNWQK